MVSVKVLVSYHKKDYLIKNNVFTPINAGRERAKNNQVKDLDWLMENCIGDDTGENISFKNDLYNEMTSIYWAWKNYDKLESPDYIGHFHYRRHLCFKDSEKTIIEYGDIGKTYLKDQLGYSQEIIQQLCENYDLIIPKPQWRKSAYEHYNRNFDIDDLDTAIYILGKKFPDYKTSAEEYLQGSELFFCNLFIMSKDIFFEYCSFIFPILEELEEQRDMKGKRMYVSEWLSGIFFYKAIKEKRVKYLPTAVAEGKTKISVAFASDKNYLFQLSTAIISLLENAKNTTSYDIYCLLAKDVSIDDKDKLQAIVNRYKNHRIYFSGVDDGMLPKIHTQIKHLSIVSYYRLLLADFLPELDKVIWLDNDLMVTDDLSVMWRIALDNNYLAGVISPGVFAPDSWKRKKLNELGVPSLKKYINAGVLIINLAEIRKNNKKDQFLELMKNEFSSDDQDVLNVSCYGKIRIIPYRFNVQAKYMKGEEAYKLELVIPTDEIDDARIKPSIVHYPGSEKPWNDLQVYEANSWMLYASKSPFTQQLEQCRAWKDYKAKQIADRAEVVINKMNMDKLPRSVPDNYTYCKDKYKISIIIPCYNAETTINETIKSCLMQMSVIPEIEILCIDDGSTDKTLGILSEWAKSYKNIKVFIQPNKGAGAARNIGIECANGEYIAFIDADDLYPTGRVMDNLYHTAKKTNSLICGGSFSSLSQGYRNGIYKFPLDGYAFLSRSQIYYSDYQFDYGYQRFIYRRDFLIDNNLTFPDYRRYQDPPFFVKAMIQAEKFMAVPEISYVYRVNHKKIGWDENKVEGFLRGVTDNLKISKKMNYATLHLYTLLHLNAQIKDFYDVLRQGNVILLNIFLETLNCIDFELIKKSEKYSEKEIALRCKDDYLKMLSDISNPTVDKNIMDTRMRLLEYCFLKDIEIKNDRRKMDELQEQIDYLNYCLNETRRSLSYKLGLGMTWIPRKIREFLKGNK